MNGLTLTVAQVADLANLAGFEVDASKPNNDGFDMDEPIVIRECKPDEFVTNEDDGSKKKYSHIAYFQNAQEEGCMPLGEVVQS